MIIKRALAQSDAVALELLQPGDRVKTAGATPAVQSVLDGLEPDPAYIFALVNAMGYSEYYGANSNRDWYGYNEHLGTNGLLHAWEGIGDNVETDRMKARNWAYGYPCFYNATVYAHHKNTDPVALGFGDVRYVFANPQMKRVELLLRIHIEEAKKKGHYSLLERINGGERSDVSMGAKVPYDIATCCADWDTIRKALATFDPARHIHPGIAVLEYHRKVRPIRGVAPTQRDYCSCYRATRGQVLPDGKKIFLYNDFPRFFDISIVHVGADRTARVMWYLGSSDWRKPAQAPQVVVPGSFRYSFEMGKVASITKEIPATLEAVTKDEASTIRVGFDKMVRPGAPEEARSLLSSAASLGIVATPREFQQIVATSSTGADRERLSQAPTFDSRFSGIDDSFAVHPHLVQMRFTAPLQQLAGHRSSFAPFLTARVARQRATVGPESVAGGEDLAALYNGYRLSVLEQLKAMDPAAVLASDRLSLKSEGSCSPGLLLGAAPLLHLVASHLRKDRDDTEHLGTMAQFLADQPTLTALAMLGAAIRVVMLTGGLSLVAAACRTVAPPR